MSQAISEPAAKAGAITPTLTFLLALSCGLVAANLYYSQPLIGLVGAAFGMSAAADGLLVTLTQLGYGLGLLLVVPLGDLIENRRLVIGSLVVAMAALAAMMSATTAALFLTATFLLGIASTAVQILLPFAAHFTTDRNRGQVIGSLTSGLMLGIMLARPAASLATHWFGWRAIFIGSTAFMATIICLLAIVMPTYRPHSTLTYGGILRSLPALLRDLPVLRRRAAYHTALFAGFSMFWTAVPLLLADDFGFSQQGIGLFAFAGTAGVIVAPLAGRIADHGLTRPATGLAILLVLLAFGLAWWSSETHSVALLVLAALLIDAGLVINFVLSQRSIYGPKPESRSRTGGLFTAIFFLGGAAGSALAAASFATGGWPLTCLIGLGLAVCAFVLYLREPSARDTAL